MSDKDSIKRLRDEHPLLQWAVPIGVGSTIGYRYLKNKNTDAKKKN